MYLRGGLTRGVVPDPERQEKQAQALRNAREQRRETRQELKKEQRRNHTQQRKLREQKLEIFRLRKDNKTTNEPAAKPRTSDKPEIGALPDFVIIGAMRCGTSRFYNLLIQHPNIKRAATKEVHYFDRTERLEKGIEWYRSCFPSLNGEDGRGSITGEATPNYLYEPLVPERMAQVVPYARLIVLLRNPADRAYSHYHQSVRRGMERRSFEAAVEEERAQLLDSGNGPSGTTTKPGVGYTPNLLAKGLYVDQLQRWSEFYDEEQMLVLKSEDYFRDTTRVLERVQDFLGLPYRKLELSPRRTSDGYEPMDPATRQRLEAYFEPYNQRLYEYLGVDLGW